MLLQSQALWFSVKSDLVQAVGFQTGDLAQAMLSRGKYVGTWTGSGIRRWRKGFPTGIAGFFDERTDGSMNKRELPSHDGSPLSSPCLKAGASRGHLVIKSNVPHFMVDGNWRISACDNRVAGWVEKSVQDVVGQLCFDVVDGHNLDGTPFCRPQCPLKEASRQSLVVNPVMVLNHGRLGHRIVKMEYAILDDPFRIVHIVRPLGDAPKSCLLTPNQWQLVQALASGLTHRQIAEKRQVALSTVTTQLKRIRRSLSCPSDTSLIRWYWNQDHG